MDITSSLYDDVARSESMEEYLNILNSLSSQKRNWVDIISKIINDNNYSVSEFAKMCGVSRQSVQKWINGALPKNRTTFIKIGFAAGYNLEDMNHFLQRYACCGKLYPRCLEDSVYIFVLSSEELEHTYEFCEEIITMLKNEISEANENIGDDIYETKELSIRISNLGSFSKMLEFVQKNASIYKQQYMKLYQYIESFVEKNLLGDAEDNVLLLADSQQWNASLRKCVSEISQKKWYPQRNKIISLGIHLNMNVDQINTMLEYAQMEPLCAKTPFENAIIYALENAMLEDKIYCDGTNELCLYVKKILLSLNYEGIDFFLDELPDDEDEEW